MEKDESGHLSQLIQTLPCKQCGGPVVWNCARVEDYCFACKERMKPAQQDRSRVRLEVASRLLAAMIAANGSPIDLSVLDVFRGVAIKQAEMLTKEYFPE